VNKEIAFSLTNPTPGVDFWWLNNGVTIVADQAQFINNRLTVENPLIVNGLQTSHELHNSAPNLPDNEARTVLVRVIVERDRVKRDEIIRATNRQTNVQHSSFRATEPIHREIEDYLKTLGYFYDRRKNMYKREGKPSDKIVSIDKLSQAVLAALKQEPHVARARPTTALKDQAAYASIFSSNRNTHPLGIYGVATRLLEAVEVYFKSIQTPANQIYRNNLRFHVTMVLAWAIHGSETFPAQAFGALDVSKATAVQLKAVTDWVFSEFDQEDAEDKTAKSESFTQRLKDNWTAAKTKV
jgi:AIPR protein